MAYDILFDAGLHIDERSFMGPLGRITGQATQFQKSMEAANARVVAFGASTAILAGITRSFRNLARSTVEVEAAFTDINRILNVTNDSLEKFGDGLFKIAKQTATSFQQTADAALEFSRQGLNMEETLKRTSDALTLVRLTGLNAKKTVELLTATVNAFTDIDTTQAVNKFVAVETKFAVAASDLVEGLSRVGSSAQDAKVDFDELNAIITAVQQTTGRGGAVIGNALKTIFTRLQRESTLESLERFNINVRDIQGNILPATVVLQNFAKQYDKLGDSTQSYLREQVAGVFQANILSAILKDLNKQQSTYASALDASNKATNEADDANEKLNQTLSALLQNTGTEIQKLQKNIGDEVFLPISKDIVKIIGSITAGINETLSGEGLGSGIAQGMLKGLRNVIEGPALGTLFVLISKLSAQAFSFLKDSLKTMLSMSNAARNRAELQQSINDIMKSDKGIMRIINDEQMQFNKKLDDTLAKLRSISTERTKQSAAFYAVSDAATATLYKESKGKVKNKATGFMPSIKAENSAIRSGIGGANGSDYPVVIPNFAFGGGKKGPVVANSGEVMVPNFDGKGGSAIFNKDMMSSFGIPNGAIPLGAKGIIPNFAGGKGYSKKKTRKILQKRKDKFQFEDLSQSIGDVVDTSIILGATLDEAVIQASQYANSMGASAKVAEKLKTKAAEHYNAQTKIVETTKKLETETAKTVKTVSESSGRFAKIGTMIEKNLLAFSIATPFITGGLEQAFFGDKKKYELSKTQQFGKNALENIPNFALLGTLAGSSVGGPVGAGIGAVAGGLLGLGVAISDVVKDLDDWKAKTEDYSQTTNELKTIAEEYIKAQETILNGATGRDLIDAQLKASDSLDKLRESGSGLADEFEKNKNNLDKLNEKLGEATEGRGLTEQLMKAQIRAMGFNFLDNRKSKAKQQVFTPLTGPYQRDITESFFGPKTEQAMFNQFKGVFGSSFSFFKDKPMGLAGTLGSSETPEDLMKVLKGVNSFTKEQSDTLLSLLQTFKKKGMFESLKKLLPEMVSAFAEAEETSRLIQESDKNFTLLKDRIAQSVKEVSLAIQERDLAKELIDRTNELNESILSSISSPLEAFERAKSARQVDFENKIARQRDEFFKENANKYTEIFKKTGLNDEKIDFIERFSKVLKEGGGGILSLREEIDKIYGKGSSNLTEAEKNMFDEVDNFFKAYDLMEEGQKNEEKLLNLRNKVELLRAENTQREEENTRKLSILRAEQSLSGAIASRYQAGTERGFQNRLTDIGNRRGLSRRQRLLLEMGARSQRYDQQIGELSSNRERDLAVLRSDKEAAKFNNNLQIENAKKMGEMYSNLLQKNADIDKEFLAKEREIIENHGKILDEANDDYNKINQEHRRELAKITPSFGAFGIGLGESFDKLKSDTESFSYTLGVDVPTMFQNNMANALNDAMDRANNLGDALRNAAVGFLSEIRNAFTRQAVGQIMVGAKMGFSSIGPKGQTGGVFKAQNGMYISGNRTGDKNPALLEDGEYVLNRNAVRALGGPRALDRLNFAVAPRFQGGGSAFLNDPVTSSRMSGLFLAGDNPELSEARQEAINALKNSLEKTAKSKQFVNAIASTLIMGAFSGAISKFSGPKMDNDFVGKTGNSVIDNSSLSKSDFGFSLNRYNGGYISHGNRMMDNVPTMMAGGEYVMNNRAVKKYGLGGMNRINSGSIPTYQIGGSMAENAPKSLNSSANTNNTISININMDRSGGISGSGMSQSGGSGDASNAQDMAKQLESAVLKVLQKEQRVSGILSNNRRR